MGNVHTTTSTLRKKLAEPETLTHEHLQQAEEAARTIGSYESRVLYVNVKHAVEANERPGNAE